VSPLFFDRIFSFFVGHEDLPLFGATLYCACLHVVQE